MTSDEWKKTEGSLMNMVPCILSVDGFRVTLTPHIDTKKGKFLIMVWVNGKMVMEFTKEVTDLQQRFCYSYEVYLYSLKMRNILKKLKGCKDKSAAKRRVHFPWFPSVKKLRIHLEKHNQEIELVQCWVWDVRVIPSDSAICATAGI